jgi:carbonic anhydrase/acetyltransferase-like protein (isoleucine patch superfamily)
MFHEYKGVRPTLGERVFIAPGAHVIGDVEIGDHSSIWFNTVVRGDVDYIRIGHRTNIQDGSICHVMMDECPLVLGDFVTVGHGVILHGCTVESHCLIGMGATIMNNVRVGEGSIVAARALLTENTDIPPRSLVMGTPGRVKRELTEAEVAGIDEYARRYCGYKDTYLAGTEKK